MSTDEDYASFLDKANQDTGSGAATSSKQKKKSGGFAQTKAVDTEVPSALQKLDAFYTSDSDEPFEAVALEYDGKDLDEDSLSKLINHSSSSGSEIEEVDLKTWNVKGQYDEVVNAVKSAAGDKKGDGIKVFRVSHGSTRCEYYVVALVAGKGRVVGVKARAVES